MILLFSNRCLFLFRLADLLEFAEDIAVDIPHLWTNLGGILGPAVEGGTLPLSDLKTLIEPLIQCNKAGLLMAETLAAAVKLSVSILPVAMYSNPVPSSSY